MKARCEHGAPWWADCPFCEVVEHVVDEHYWSTRFPLWRNMDLIDVWSYIHAMARRIILGKEKV